METMTDEQPIERNPFDRKPPSKEEAEKELMNELKKYDTFVGYDTTKPGADGFFNMAELNNYFKNTKPFIPKSFFQGLYKFFVQNLEDNDNLLNLRFYIGLSDKFSEKFRESMSKEEMLKMQTEQADPYYRLDEDVEKLLGLTDPQDKEQYYGEYTAKLLQDQSDKQLLEQIKYFDSFVGDDTTKKGKDGFLNEYEFLNYVNYIMQGNPDKEYVRQFKMAYYDHESYKQSSKVAYKPLLVMFDTFQDQYFSKYPEKWKEIEADMMREHEEREKKMAEYRDKVITEEGAKDSNADGEQNHESEDKKVDL